MSNYTPHTQKEIKQMLDTVGVSSLEELYADLPEQIRLKNLDLPSGKSQMEVEKEFVELSKQNKCYETVLRGAGIYDHYIPAAVNAAASREEFVTAYTPYQPEISQGILQSIFEYQTMMCELTGMDVSNASVYDCATAAAEAVVMCCEHKKTALLLGQINPEYLAVINTYCYAHNLTMVHIEDVSGYVDLNDNDVGEDVACVVAQCPNYLGLIEDMKKVGDYAKRNDVKFIYIFNAIAASLLATPAECGADIAVGEGQPLGLPMAYGGATVGIMCAVKAMSRKLPGRIVGQTVDTNGKRCFVLTLQAREQHIRREKASSSVCSNQAHNALTCAIYLSCVGKNGLREIAQRCVDNAHYLANEIVKCGGKLKYDGEFFHEFVTVGGKSVIRKAKKYGILGGLPIGNDVLWCATEKADKTKLDVIAKLFKEEAK